MRFLLLVLSVLLNLGLYFFQIATYLCKVYSLLKKSKYDEVRLEMEKLPTYNPSNFTIATDGDTEVDVSEIIHQR